MRKLTKSEQRMVRNLLHGCHAAIDCALTHYFEIDPAGMADHAEGLRTLERLYHELGGENHV